MSRCSSGRAPWPRTRHALSQLGEGGRPSRPRPGSGTGFARGAAGGAPPGSCLLLSTVDTVPVRHAGRAFVELSCCFPSFSCSCLWGWPVCSAGGLRQRAGCRGARTRKPGHGDTGRALGAEVTCHAVSLFTDLSLPERCPVLSFRKQPAFGFRKPTELARLAVGPANTGDQGGQHGGPPGRRAALGFR